MANEKDAIKRIRHSVLKISHKQHVESLVLSTKIHQNPYHYKDASDSLPIKGDSMQAPKVCMLSHLRSLQCQSDTDLSI